MFSSQPAQGIKLFKFKKIEFVNRMKIYNKVKKSGKFYHHTWTRIFLAQEPVFVQKVLENVQDMI